MTRWALPAALLLLAGCGAKGPLEPVPPRTLPVAPLGQSVSPTPTQMLKLSPQAAPERIDDPVRRSEERPDDRFNLPPG